MQLAFRIMGLAGRMLFVLGAICLLLGTWLIWQSQDLQGDAVRTTGRVVSYHEIRDGDDVRYRPRVRFRTAAGDIITVGGQVSAASQRFAIGTQVPMVYKIAKPTEARIALFTDNWLGACVALLVGAVGIAGGWLVRRAVRRELAGAG